MFCACDIIRLYPVVFCVVRAARKFDFRHVVDETPNKWLLVRGHADIKNHVFDIICMFFLRTSLKEVTAYAYNMEVICFLLSNRL